MQSINRSLAVEFSRSSLFLVKFQKLTFSLSDSVLCHGDIQHG